MTPTSTTGELLPLLVIAFAIGLLPFVAMMVTSYTKIVVVLGLLRNALGVQQVPPNMVLNGVAIIVSAYIMAPVAMESFDASSTSPGASTLANARSSGDARRRKTCLPSPSDSTPSTSHDAFSPRCSSSTAASTWACSHSVSKDIAVRARWPMTTLGFRVSWTVEPHSDALGCVRQR